MATCPVDHSKWPTEGGPAHPMRPSSDNAPSTDQVKLSQDRVTSSIPRGGQAEGSNWVYPSPAQFHAALQRKQKEGNSAKDMDIIVPIHNAVNERCWDQVLQWEAQQGPLDQVKLVSFKGRPNDRTPRAWFKTLIGYQAPFDRHDWLIDRRDGTQIRYVIDFYSGKLPLSFHLDVRPALDSFAALKMRFTRFFLPPSLPSSSQAPNTQ